MKTTNFSHKHMKALSALFLCVAMVLTMIPMGALTVNAAEEGSYFFADDFSTFAPLVSTTKPTSNTWWITAEGNAAWVEADENVTIGTHLYYNVPNGITQDFTVEFTYQLAEGKTCLFELGETIGSSSCPIYMTLAGGNASNSDRINAQHTNDSSIVTYYMDGIGQKHTVKVVVSYTNKTYCVYTDGELQTATINGTPGVSDLPFTKTTKGFSRIIFRNPNGIVIDDFKFYTNDMENVDSWTVNQQADLGENIHMNFTGTVGASSGIASVQAVLGDRTVTDNDLSDGFAVTVPVAAAELAETITLNGLNAEGTAVQSKTYTVEEYLNQVKALDEAKYGSIVNHTLNYGAAAATYFGKTAVTAPEGLTLTDIPSAEEGVNVTTTNLKYSLPYNITEDYTLEFKYQVPVADGATANQSARVYLSNGNPSDSTSQVKLQITGAYENETYGDRMIVNAASGSVICEKDGAKTYGEWHSVKVVVDQANKIVKVYVNGSTESKEYAYQNTALTYVNAICFQNGTILIDDVKFTVGGTELLNDSFTTFEPVINGSWNTVPQGDWWTAAAANVTLNTAVKNPVEGACDGIIAESATLLIKDRVEIRYCFALETGSIGEYAFSINGNAATPVQNGDKYYVYSNGINPQMYDNDTVLTVTKGEQSMSVTYNPMDYIQRMYFKSTDNSALTNMLQAMYNYHLSATEYLLAAN